MGSAGKSFDRAFWFLFLANFFSFMALEFGFPVVSLWIADLGGSGLAVGAAMAAMVGSALLARLAAPWLMARFGARHLAGAALLFQAASLACQILAETVTVALLARAMFGIGYGLATTALNAWALAGVPNERMGAAVGMFGVGTTFAMCAGPYAGFLAYETYGGGILANAGGALAMVLLGFLPLLFVRAPLPGIAAGTPARQPPLPAGVRGPMAATALISLCYGTIMSFLAIYATGLGIADAGLYFLVQAVAAGLVRYGAGRVQDRFGLRFVLVPGFLLAATGLVLLALLDGQVTLIAAGILFGAGFGIIEPAGQAWTMVIFPRAQSARANAMFFNAFDIGMATGALTVGFLVDDIGYSTTFATAAALLAGAAALSLRVRPFPGGRDAGLAPSSG